MESCCTVADVIVGRGCCHDYDTSRKEVSSSEALSARHDSAGHFGDLTFDVMGFNDDTVIEECIHQ